MSKIDGRATSMINEILTTFESLPQNEPTPSKVMVDREKTSSSEQLPLRWSPLVLLAVLLSFSSSNAWTTNQITSLRQPRSIFDREGPAVSSNVLASTKKDSGESLSNAQPKGRLFAQNSLMKETTKRTNRQPQSNFKSDSAVSSRNLERIRSAGREGSVTFIDPCRVFFGNLDLTVTSDDLCQFVADHHGLPPTFLIVDAEVITDWRTGQSKGYGFVRYTEPVYASNALDTCNGKVWHGRRLSVKPAINASKQKEVKRQRELYEQRQRRRELAKENGEEIKQKLPNLLSPTDPRGQAFLRSLDPDLVDDREDKASSSSDEDVISNKNRKQRRKEERARPKKKPISKGFGS